MTTDDGARSGRAFLEQLARWSAESGRRTAGLAALMVRLAAPCAELVQEVPRQMVGKGLPADPLDATLRLYDATSGPLSTIFREALTDDAFLQVSRSLLENWITAESVFARLSEDVFRRLQLSTSSDTARVAALVVGLDEKVDRLDDAVDDLGHGAGARSRAAELARLQEQVARLEAKLDLLLAAGPDTDAPDTTDGAGNGTRNRKGARR